MIEKGTGILLMGNYPPPYGGIPMHLKYLCEYLLKQGYSVHVLSLTHHPKFGGAEKAIIDGCTIYRPSKARIWLNLFKLTPTSVKLKPLNPLKHPRNYLLNIAAFNYVQDIITKNNIKIISAYHIMTAFLATWVCETNKIPLVTSIFGEIYSNPSFYEKHINFVKHVCAKSNILLSCSDHCGKSFSKINLSPHVKTVYHAIDCTRFHPIQKNKIHLTNVHFGNNNKIVLFVGRMVEEMGLHILLNVIPSLADQLNFFIVGRSGELTKRAFEVAQIFLNKVYIFPNVPYEDLPQYYALCDICVVPSINERACLGMAIAEAGATEKPVIAANAGGTKEILKDGETGILIPPNDVSALIKAILTLVNDDEKCKKMGIAGRKWIVSKFNKDYTNNEMVSIFDELLKGASKNGLKTDI